MSDALHAEQQLQQSPQVQDRSTSSIAAQLPPALMGAVEQSCFDTGGTAVAVRAVHSQLQPIGIFEPGNSNDQDDDNCDDDSDSEGRPARGKRQASRAKKPHLQGRFSGRLATKDDEKRLAEECRLLAPLVGGVGKRGDRSRLTLAKIVRGIATGDVRRHLEAREVAHKAMAQQLADVQVAGGVGSQQQLQLVRELQQQVAALQNELHTKDLRLQQLDVSLQQLKAGTGQRQEMATTNSGPTQRQPAEQTLGTAVTLEQELQSLHADLQNAQAQAQVAAQGHSAAMARAQSLHDHARTLMLSYHKQGQVLKTEDNGSFLMDHLGSPLDHEQGIREASVAAQQAEAQANVHAQSHQQAQQAAQQLQARIQQIQAQLAYNRNAGQLSLQQHITVGHVAMPSQQPSSAAPPASVPVQQTMPVSQQGNIFNILLEEDPIVTIDDHYQYQQCIPQYVAAAPKAGLELTYRQLPAGSFRQAPVARSPFLTVGAQATGFQVQASSQGQGLFAYAQLQ